MVQDISELADILREAFRIANSGRKGPVLVDIPKDVTAAITDFEPETPNQIEDNTVLIPEKLEEAAKYINAAHRPVIEIGGGVVSSEASDLVRELVEKAGIPACHTLMAAGVLGYSEPLNYGLVGMHGSYVTNKAIDEADCLLAIGTRFSDRVALNTDRFANKAKVIQIDIDQSEINKNVMVDTYLTGDIKTILTALMPLIKPAEHKDWLTTLITIARFGKYDISHQMWPVLELMDTIDLPGSFIERQDALIMTFWIISIFMIVNAGIFFSAVIGKDIAKKGTHTKFICVFVPIIYIISFLPKDIEMVYKVVDFSNITFGTFYIFILPIALYFIMKIRGDSNDKKNS